MGVARLCFLIVLCCFLAGCSTVQDTQQYQHYHTVDEKYGKPGGIQKEDSSVVRDFFVSLLNVAAWLDE